MLFECDPSAAAGYTSKSQISRVLSEKWLGGNGYCLSCDNDRLTPTTPNTKASDFLCDTCNQSYELKAFSKKPSRTLVDGAYAAMISRIQSGSVPVLMLLERNDRWQVQNLTAIHHLFLTPEVIEMRKPLSPTARRAGWIGCNIRLDLIASDAQIEIVRGAAQTDRRLAREAFRRFNRLHRIAPNARGWATLTLQAVRNIDRSTFSLDEIYAKESFFAKIYPKNNNVRAKLRQQLQVLRNLGCLEFRGRGQYKLLI